MCTDQLNVDWLGINVSFRLKIFAFFFYFLWIKRESDLDGNKQEGKFSVELEEFITVMVDRSENFSTIARLGRALVKE